MIFMFYLRINMKKTEETYAAVFSISHLFDQNKIDDLINVI